MTSHVVVIAADMRRATIKVEQSTYLTKVLEEACTKLKLPSEKYLLRRSDDKAVDLSNTYRISGLVRGAKLNLVQKSKTPSAIRVALRFPQPEAKDIPGGKLEDKFRSDLTLWQLLRQFESGKASDGRNINITGKGHAKMAEGSSGSGQLLYESPILRIENRRLTTFVDFQQTLSQLGYNSGSVMIHLSFEGGNQPFHEAAEEIKQYFKEEGQESTAGSASVDLPKPGATEATDPDAGGDTPMRDAPPEPTQPPVPTQLSEPHSKVLTSEERSPEAPSPAVENGTPSVSDDPYAPAHVFLAPSNSTPAAALAPYSEPDSAPSIAQAQEHQHRLLENSKNKRLMSDEELEEKRAAGEAKIAAVKSVLVRVRFPDNTTSEWSITPEKTGAFLYEAVRRVMVHRDQPFRLVVPPGNKTVIKDDDAQRHSLIKAYNLRGPTLVNFLWDDSVKPEIRKQQPFLKDNVTSQGEDVKVPELPQAQDEQPKASGPALEPKKEDKSKGLGLKKPKWMQLGKK